MDINAFQLFIKLITEEYKLSEREVIKLTRRLLADETEFERVWRLYQNKRPQDGVDEFKPLLQDLLS